MLLKPKSGKSPLLRELPRVEQQPAELDDERAGCLMACCRTLGCAQLEPHSLLHTFVDGHYGSRAEKDVMKDMMTKEAESTRYQHSNGASYAHLDFVPPTSPDVSRTPAPVEVGPLPNYSWDAPKVPQELAGSTGSEATGVKLNPNQPVQIPKPQETARGDFDEDLFDVGPLTPRAAGGNGPLGAEGRVPPQSEKNNAAASISSTPGPSPGEKKFTVILSRDSSTSGSSQALGVDIVHEPITKPQWLRIKQLSKADGMIMAWNRENPDDAVHVDDVLIKINEVSGNAPQMIEELRNPSCDFFIIEVVRGRTRPN
jgi:hypothetical protein